MKHLIYILFLIYFFSLPTFGQRYRIIFEDGSVEEWNSLLDEPRVGGLISHFRCVYDRYPSSKKELLLFHKEESRFNHYELYRPFATNRELRRIIRNRNNVLQVFGDSCSFFIKNLRMVYSGRASILDQPEEIIDSTGGNMIVRPASYRPDRRYRYSKRYRNVTYSFVGGPADLQPYDYVLFLWSTKIRCFDKHGRIIYPLIFDSPALDSCVRRTFRYCVAFDGGFAKSNNPGLITGKSFNGPYYPELMIPITMNRSGEFYYDLSHVKGWHFYYRDYPSSIHGVLGDIKLEDAIEQDYINAIKSHLTEFLKQHPEVETIKTWEYLLFNDPPKEGDSASYL